MPNGHLSRDIDIGYGIKLRHIIFFNIYYPEFDKLGHETGKLGHKGSKFGLRGQRP